MNQKIDQTSYKPGYYPKKRLSTKEWIDANIKQWTKDQIEKDRPKGIDPIPTSICFSREIGVGALEVADALAEILHFRVVDREIIEQMAIQANLTEPIIEFYDERYPGKMSELFSMLTSSKTFLQSDYARQLVKTVTTLASMEPTIFVGRGTHLILPRSRVLSIRLVCSKEYRMNRLASLIDTSRAEIEKKVRIIDNDQSEFFKTVYRKKSIDKEEFDLIINRDFLGDAKNVAQIIACAYEHRFEN